MRQGRSRGLVDQIAFRVSGDSGLAPAPHEPVVDAPLPVGDVHAVDGKADAGGSLILQPLHEVQHAVFVSELPAGRVLPPVLGSLPRFQVFVDAAVGDEHGFGSRGAAGGLLLSAREEAVLAAGRTDEDGRVECPSQEIDRGVDLVDVGQDLGPEDDPLEGFAVVAE